ncbi:hypothetical protein [Vibrio alfacsensis]|uniref:hypothetical protein n=1 Tax=Vibrio alfacsensis TaxID=1074311 RepID=UPI0040682496
MPSADVEGMLRLLSSQWLAHNWKSGDEINSSFKVIDRLIYILGIICLANSSHLKPIQVGIL